MTGDQRPPEEVPGDEGRLAGLVGRLDLAGKVRLSTGANHWELWPEPAVGLWPVVLADGPFDAEMHRRQESAAEHDLAAGAEVLLEVRATEWDRAQGVGFPVGVERPVAAPEVLLAEAAEVAGGADVAVVVVGTTEQVESEGFDRSTLALPGRQDDLVRAVVAANPRTIAVVNAGGRPLATTVTV